MPRQSQGQISNHTRRTIQVLGSMIEAARKERRMSQEELASRLGVTRPTVRAIELGSPSVSLGSAFEAATIVGIPLVAEDSRELDAIAKSIAAISRVLPKRARRKQTDIDDDF